MASHRRPPQPGPVRTARMTVASAAAATAAALSAAVPAGAAPHETPARVASRVRALYEQAERATESYDAAQERERRLGGQVEVLQDRLARGQQAVNRMRDGLGALAAARYQDGGIDPSLALLLSSDPRGFLDRAATFERVAGRRSRQLHRLRDAERALRQSRALAAERLAELDHTRTALAARKRTVQHKLGEARRLLNSLAPAQQAAYGLGPDAPAAQHLLPPVLPQSPAPSGRAAEAVAAVRSALGAPYEWGSAGPGAFDCSGLMWWAYQRAGVTLPRTSQGQLRAGRRVPPSQVRPGDLVIYRDDASHVGMYVGGGRVIHAPYPGARVRYDRMDMLPIAAVTRV